MATKPDVLAAKQRKQKVILVAGGVVFLALAAFQGPKLWKQLHPAKAATPAAAATASASTPDAGAPAATSSTPGVSQAPPPASVPASQRASLAGVIVVPEQPIEPDVGQLDSFSGFDAKDPFVPQVKDTVASRPASAPAQSTAPAAAPSVPAPASGAGGPLPVIGSGRGSSSAPVALPEPTSAIVRVNGVMQVLEPKQAFPKGDKVFRLVSLQRGVAKLGVVGGSYVNGSKTITIRVGKPVTLLNTATGVRYVIKLVYVGADAGQLTGFAAPTAPQSK